jgi:predicted transcriptional regulator
MSTLKEINSLAKKALGLTEKQSLVYGVLAKEGFLNPSQISRLINIKRTTVYLELEELKKKGLLIEKRKGKRKLIGIADPQTLRLFIHEEKEELQRKEGFVENMISLVENLDKNVHEKTDVETLEGKAGIMVLIEKMLKERSDVYWFGTMDTMFNVFSVEQLYKLYSLRRMEFNTTAYSITDRSVLQYKKMSERIGKFRDFRFLEEKIPIPGVFIMFGNTIGLIRADGKEIKIVLIRDNVMQGLLQAMFRLLWNSLPKV